MKRNWGREKEQKILRRFGTASDAPILPLVVRPELHRMGGRREDKIKKLVCKFIFHGSIE